MGCHEPGVCSLCGETHARGAHETQSEIDPRCGALLIGGAGIAPHRPGTARRATGDRTRTRSRSSAPRSPRSRYPLLLAAGPGRPRTQRAGAREGHRHGRALPHRRAGRRAARSRASTLTEHKLSGQGRERAWRPRATASSARTAARAASRRRSSRPRRRTPASPRSSPSARPSRARTSSPSSSPRAPRRPRTAPSPPCCTCPTSTPVSGSPRR